MQTCEHCRWWQGCVRGRVHYPGECLRYPPPNPTTTHRHFCGEFTARSASDQNDDALVEREPWEVLRSYCSGGLPFHHNGDGWKTIANAVIRAAEARAKLEGAKAMQEAVEAAFKVADASPELNISNYDHDQVDALNKAMIEVHGILEDALDGIAALDPAQIAGGKP